MSAAADTSPIAALVILLRALKLPTIAHHAAEVAMVAEREGWSFVRYLHHLVELEIHERRRRRIERNLRQAEMPADKTLATLDRSRLPAKVAKMLPTLCEGAFLARGDNLLAFGLPGRGKTHLVCAIGHELIQRGYRVLFVAAFALVQRLLAAKRDLRLEQELATIDGYDAVILDDTDGTTWLKAGVVLALWTIASTAATVFKIVADGSRATLAPLYGTLRGILVSDRATALAFWAMERRQICWAHLLRKYVSFSERAGPAGDLGRQLLDYTGLLFDYWHDYKAGRLDRATFLAWMAPVRAQVEAVLERAVASGIDRLAGSCANILDHRTALWTFIEVDGVEPTNNHAERELRAFVLWRRRCFGAQSERGNLFAERLMTVAHTARKQRKDVLSFLTACCQAQLDGTRAPSLFAAA